jgi:hypothetical protein
MVEHQDSTKVLENLSALELGLEAIRTTLHDREAVLLDRAP